LADRIAQCRTPFIVESTKDGSITQLSGAAEFSKQIAECATRYVLSDELTRLCTALAYSKGAGTLACADLLHVPAERVWVEWPEAPWRSELALYGFKGPADPAPLHPNAAGELAIALADQQALPAAEGLVPGPAASPTPSTDSAGTD